MDVAKTRFENSVSDLLSLDVSCYCDLGSEYGNVPIELKRRGKKVITVEAEWNKYLVDEWGPKEDINYYIADILLDDLSIITERVECFSLMHAIAHFHIPPQYLFEKLYSLLPPGGYFYLSTVNACSLEKTMKLFRGNPITGKVLKHHNPNNNVNVYLHKVLGINHQLTVSEWMHVKEYTKPELEDMLREESFTIVKSFYRNNFNHWKQRLASWYRPSLSEEIVIIAQKQ